MDFQFETCRRMIFAPGASEQLPTLCRELGLKHLLLVTDPGLSATGIVDSIGKLLERAGVAPDRPLTSNDIRGLPLTETVWDET